VSYADTPTSVRSLEQRIRNLEGDDGLALRRRVGMALVVVGQMLPEGAIKGGSAMALRYGRGTRFTQDLDAARVQPLARFRSDFEESLSRGWAGFTGHEVAYVDAERYVPEILGNHGRASEVERRLHRCASTSRSPGTEVRRWHRHRPCEAAPETPGGPRHIGICDNALVISTGEDRKDANLPELEVPPGWSAAVPDEADAEELTALLRGHEKTGRGWGSSGTDDVRVEVGAKGSMVRENLVLRDPQGRIRGWATAHDRASGRMLMQVVVDRDRDSDFDDEKADEVAAALFEWADWAARSIGRGRELAVQQIDSGAFADDEQQHRWLERAGYDKVRSWWQMNRPVAPEDVDLAPEPDRGVVIRPVMRQGGGMPDEEDLRTVHDILESAFADHFNSREETFDEFIFRLREDPGHRWDHWWIAEIVDGERPEPAGTLVGTMIEGGLNDQGEPQPDGSYVSYLGVLQSARGRGVAKALLNMIIADAAARARNRVGLEVDADSPTRADALYVSMGWETKYMTESWHKDVPVE
jgi:ribosomal protein S18 acetylase RimI-like enzyme